MVIEAIRALKTEQETTRREERNKIWLLMKSDAELIKEAIYLFFVLARMFALWDNCAIMLQFIIYECNVRSKMDRVSFNHFRVGINEFSSTSRIVQKLQKLHRRLETRSRSRFFMQTPNKNDSYHRNLFPCSLTYFFINWNQLDAEQICFNKRESSAGLQP